MERSYQEFLESKMQLNTFEGFKPIEINPMLFDFQAAIVQWACRKGRACIFADCGLGKSPMQLEWARQVVNHTGGDVLIVAPLAVAQQTQGEGVKFGVDVKVCREQADVRPGINITNYEMLHAFDASKFVGIILDESSIIKNFAGKYRNYLIDEFRDTKYKLCCTATPAPNDYMELGNHSEFMGSMKREEMLAMYFYNDGSETQKWHLKGHAEMRFWEWVASWAVYIQLPSDIGYDDKNFILPEIKFHQIKIETEKAPDGQLFALIAKTLQERIQARRNSVDERVSAVAEIVNELEPPALIWCNLNDESHKAAESISIATEITGAHTNEYKEKSMIAFTKGDIKVLISKPKLSGFGMNWQHCSNVIFLGLSDSWEQYYQAIRRCWRFEQKKTVNVYVVISESEGEVLANIMRKERDAKTMADNMKSCMVDFMKKELKENLKIENKERIMKVKKGENWTLINGDCVEQSKQIADDSIGLSIFSPPFASLYTYTDMESDMGNCKNDNVFYEHFNFLIDELYRVTMPGRHVAFHCMNLPMLKSRHGHIGIRDFRGELIRMFVAKNFIYHSEVCIWKDPVTAMQRTKALGLLHKQIKKDSAMSRMGIPDYMVVMRKPGENPNPITHTAADFPVEQWQQWASPIWTDIKQSNTLQKVREERDEKHICPLQLDVIERSVILWSNHGDLIFSPFAGIGSEGFESLLLGRKFIGIELKEIYFNQAALNLELAERTMTAKGNDLISAMTDAGDIDL